MVAHRGIDFGESKQLSSAGSAAKSSFVLRNGRLGVGESGPREVDFAHRDLASSVATSCNRFADISPKHKLYILCFRSVYNK